MFWKLVKKAEGCWRWLGAHDHHGYGVFRTRRWRKMAHRMAYELVKGIVPDGLELDHLCRDRGCINPAHLEAVTHRINILRGNTLMAENTRKTHCIRGHELTGKNLRIKQGARFCLKCDVIRTRKYKQERKLG